MSGNGGACLEEGLTLAEARAPREESRARFLRACHQGLALACTNWGASYWANGFDDVGSRQCVTQVFEKTCAAKDRFGCSMASRLLIELPRDRADVARGRSLLQDACNSYKGPPCRFLAYYMEQGRFGKPDRAEIVALMARACEGGDRGACGAHATVAETFPHD
jgi:hypothetical protein